MKIQTTMTGHQLIVPIDEVMECMVCGCLRLPRHEQLTDDLVCHEDYICDNGCEMDEDKYFNKIEGTTDFFHLKNQLKKAGKI